MGPMNRKIALWSPILGLLLAHCSAQVTPLRNSNTRSATLSTDTAKSTTDGSTTTIPVDPTYPVPGGNGVISLVSRDKNAISISWSAGTDDVTSASSLKYQVYYATSAMATVAKVDSIGTAYSFEEPNLTSRSIYGLAAGTTYYVTVVVKDGDGKRTIYTTVQTTTLAAPNMKVWDLVALPGTNPGEVNLTWTAPAASDGSAVDSYEIRYSIPHMTSATVSSATTVANALTPKAPGSTETTTLSGLTAGATYQFTVRPVKSGSTGAFAISVGGKVKSDPALPTVPGGSTLIGALPFTANVAGTYYYLNADFIGGGAAAATAITVTADNITIDMQGHTIAWDSGNTTNKYGITASNRSGLTIMNGTLTTAATQSGVHGIFIQSSGNVRVTNMTINSTARNSRGIWVTGTSTGPIRVDHNTVSLSAAILNATGGVPNVDPWAIGVDSDFQVEIDNNTVTATPRGGIMATPNTSAVIANPHYIHHNKVTGITTLNSANQNARAYMMTLMASTSDGFENYLSGTSQGVNLYSNSYVQGSWKLHDNFINGQLDNNTFPEAIGIEIEDAGGASVYNNFVTMSSQNNFNDAVGISLNMRGGSATDNTGMSFKYNRIYAINTDAAGTDIAKGLQYEGTNAANDLVFSNNLITATDYTIYNPNNAAHMGTLQQNIWERDMTLGGGHTWYYLHVNAANALLEMKILDPYTTQDITTGDQWGGAAAYTTTREWTTYVRVVDANGLPVSGATVTATNTSSVVQWTGSTDSNGVASGAVASKIITLGPVVTDKNPFTIAVTKAGVGTYSGSYTINGRTGINVNLAAGTAALDTTAPTSPYDVFSKQLSATRIYTRWNPSSDATGVAYYLIYLDGTLIGTSDTTDYVVAGLTPATGYTVSVKAVDWTGNESTAATYGLVTTNAEDRGT